MTRRARPDWNWRSEAAAARRGCRAACIGDFNVDNLLTVLAVLLAWDMPLSDGLRGAGALLGAAGTHAAGGRRQPAPLVLIDYAHTPDALAKALHAARAHCRGRLRCVFGCGGERDSGKRSEMGRIAAQRRRCS